MSKRRHRDSRGQPLAAGVAGSGVPHRGQMVAELPRTPERLQGPSARFAGGGVVIDESRVVPPVENDPAVDEIRDRYDGTRRSYLDELPDITQAGRPTFVGPPLDSGFDEGGSVVLLNVGHDFGGVMTAMSLGQPGRVSGSEVDEAAALARGLVAAGEALKAVEAEEDAREPTPEEFADETPAGPTAPKKRNRYWWIRAAAFWVVTGIGKLFEGLLFVTRFVVGAAICVFSAAIAVVQGGPSVSALGFHSQRRRAGRVARDLSRTVRESTPKPIFVNWLTFPLSWVLQWPGVFLAELKFPWDRWYERPERERDDIDDEEYLRPHEPIMWGKWVSPVFNGIGSVMAWTDRVYPRVERWFGMVGAFIGYYVTNAVLQVILALLYVVVVAAVCVALVFGYSLLVVNVVLSLFVAFLDVVRVFVAMGGIHAAPKRTRRVLNWAAGHLPWDERYYTYGRFRVYIPFTGTLLFEVSA